MRPIVREWVLKADGDFSTARRELGARKQPNYDGVCFHSQQCAEKYMKALLQNANIGFPKTHNLVALLELFSQIDASWELLRLDLQRLTAYAVTYRYPGETADKVTARDAMEVCRAIRDKARASLGLED